MANKKNKQSKNSENTKATENEKNTSETEENGEEKEASTVDGQNQMIIDTGIVATNAKHAIHCLTVIGQIEGHYIRSEERRVGKEC